MPFVPIDISTGYSPDTDAAGDGVSVLTNWRMVDPASDGRPRINLPRPGTTARTVSGLSSSVVGAYRYANARQTILVTADRYVYRVSDADQTIAIPLSTSTSSTQLDGLLRPVFAEDSTGVLIAGGGRISKWSPGDPTATQIIAGSAPVRATHVAAIGQRIVATDQTTTASRGQFFYSDLGAGNDTIWGALSFITADARTDQVVGVYENTSELFVFGQTTLQVYSISTDPLAPYSSIGTAANVGCIAPYSPTRIDNQFVFLDDARRIVLSDGRQVQDITGNIQSELRGLATVSDCWGWRERHDRYDLLCLHFPSAMKTYETPIKRLGEWTVRAKYDAGQGLNIDIPIGAYAYNDALDKHFFGLSNASTGGFYLDSSSTVDYDGSAILCERWTGYTDYGTPKRKRSRVIRAYLKTGTAGAVATPGAIEVSVSDDDRPWSPWVPMSIANAGGGQTWADAYLGGVFVRRRTRFRYATKSTESTSLLGAADDVTELAL